MLLPCGKDEHGGTRPACVGRAETLGPELCPVPRKENVLYAYYTVN
jgi:hypothetical protein